MMTAKAVDNSLLEQLHLAKRRVVVLLGQPALGERTMEILRKELLLIDDFIGIVELVPQMAGVDHGVKLMSGINELLDHLETRLPVTLQ